MFRTVAFALALAACTAGGAAAAVPIVPPAIVGTPAIGETLTATSGGWLGMPMPVSYVYAWERCDAGGASCAAIAGTSAATYLATAADLGSTLRVVVTADGTPSESGPTGVVLATAPVPPAPATAPANVQPVPPANPDLSIAQVTTRSTLSFELGDTATVAFSVQNTVADVEDAQLGLSLPSGVQLASMTTDRGECTVGPSPACDLGALAVGDAVHVSLTVKLLLPGPQTISAWVWHDGADAAPSDNQVVVTVQGSEQPNLYANVAGTARATVGTDVRYVFTVKNGGPEDASPVAVLVGFTPAATVRSVSGAACQGHIGRLACTIATLPAQGWKKLTVIVRFAKPGSYTASLRAAEGAVSAAQPPWVTLVTRAERR